MIRSKLFSTVSVFALIFLAFSQVSRANDGGFGYDSIVKELSGSSSRYEIPDYDPLGNVKIHTGVAAATSFLNMEVGDQLIDTAYLKGVQVSLGIDLFSNRWMAEGTVRTFNREKVENTFISLKEFDLRFIYRTPFSRNWQFRTGLGIAARYLTYKAPVESPFNKRYTTPSSVFLLALDARVTDTISIGTEIAYRNSFITDTIDRNALDTNIRIDAHF